MEEMLLQRLRSIKDFPVPGINFRDITSWFADEECIRLISRTLLNQYIDEDVDKIVAIEARGFIVGAILAVKLGKPLFLARKPGKLPIATDKHSYSKEYGLDSIELESGVIKENDVVLIVDDLLATGGTASAVVNLVKKYKPSRILCGFLIEILDEGCKGRAALEALGAEIKTIISI